MPKKNRHSLKSKYAKKLLLTISKNLQINIEKFFESKNKNIPAAMRGKRVLFQSFGLYQQVCGARLELFKKVCR